jgi:hypothetical protein
VKPTPRTLQEAFGRDEHGPVHPMPDYPRPQRPIPFHGQMALILVVTFLIILFLEAVLP